MSIEKLTEVSVVIPVFNEIGALEKTVHDVVRYLEDSGLVFEIILVDDGSTDGSSEVMDGINLPRVKAIHHEVNRGYGAALKTGLKAAQYDLMAITDADGTYPNERLPELVKALGDGDMIVGARTGQNVHIPTVRKPAKRALNELANHLSGSKIPDLNSGLRVMRKETVKRFLYILPDSFSFTTTITLAMLSDGRSVRYVPVNYFLTVRAPRRSTLSKIQFALRSSSSARSCTSTRCAFLFP
jgi:glycosyltransferase involved in cell wall biosynthesis